MKLVLKPIRWESVGPLDLIPQLDEAQRWAAEIIAQFGSLEPPNGGPRNRCMRSICMTAEGCAYYYAMAGDTLSLSAVRRAVENFRKYRHAAREKRVPYLELGSDDETIKYEMIAIHVGRNMRGMRAAAHVLGDDQLAAEVKEELDYWIDTRPGYDWENHRFDCRIYPGTNERFYRFIMNMMGSLASAMWLTGHDLDDERLMSHAEDQILNGILPYQMEDGFFPYCYTFADPTGRLLRRSDSYHALTTQVLSPLLAYPEWQGKADFVTAMRNAADYIKIYTRPSGMPDGVPNMQTVLEWNQKALGRIGPSSPYSVAADSILIHTRLYKYLGDRTALEQASKTLRWMHFNSPLGIPFMPETRGKGNDVFPSEAGYSHTFRQLILAAYEGLHLRQTGPNDVEAVLIPAREKARN